MCAPWRAIDRSANNTATCRISIAHSHYSWRSMCTHSRDRTLCGNNTVTCRIFNAHSRATMILPPLFRREAMFLLFSLILPWPPRSTLCAPWRVNGFISFKPFLYRKLDHFRISNIWQCWNSRTWPIIRRHFEILLKSNNESPLIPKCFQCEKSNQRGSKK